MLPCMGVGIEDGIMPDAPTWLPYFYFLLPPNPRGQQEMPHFLGQKRYLTNKMKLRRKV